MIHGLEYCGSCANAEDHGIVGTVATCRVSNLTRNRGDLCDVLSWELETRSFDEMYPDYPYAIQDAQGQHLRKRIAAAAAGEADLVAVQPGLAQIRGKVQHD